MKTINKSLILLALITVFTTVINAQSSKIAPGTVVKYSTSPSGSTNDPNALTSIKPQEKVMSSEKQALLNQLETARTANDMISKERIEAQLNRLNGNTNVALVQNPNIIGGSAPASNKVPFNNEHDYMTSTIVTTGLWSSATQTVPPGSPTAGTIWVATTVYNPSGSDTCKLYFSNDGGVTWSFGYYFYINTNMDFRKGELDLELAYDGSVLWIYGVAGYDDLATGQTKSILFRFNTTANTFNGYILSWPGIAALSNKYYNPRITSDNSFYTGTTYIYLSCSLDTTESNNLHAAKQKYAHVTNPFVANPVIDYNQPNSFGGFYWSSSGLPANHYIWSDLAYFRTSASNNRIITSYTNTGGNNIYLAWSDDFGASVAGNSVILDTKPLYGTRIAFNGGASNYNGIITYIRQYSGNDWDPYAQSTTNGGANWTSNIIDLSTNRARTVDVIAVRNAANIFKVAYTQDSSAGNFGYYTGGSALNWTMPVSHVVTPNNIDTAYTKIIAGYKNGGGDDCFAVYSLGSGTWLYGSRACMTTLGINSNNDIAKDFSLKQNYPNPFNPTTNISFSIPKTGLVKLVVFDITGKQVETLVNENMASGSYTVNFDATSLASGAYFYKLETDGFTEVKKMLLIK